jgi:hypothetical protein
MAVVTGTAVSNVDPRDRHHSVASKQAADLVSGHEKAVAAR